MIERSVFSGRRAALLSAVLLAGCGQGFGEIGDTKALERRSFAVTLSVPAQHATIREAVDAAQDGDTIRIGPGVYEELVSLNSLGLTIVGAGMGRTTVIGGFEISEPVEAIMISDMSIRPGGAHECVFVEVSNAPVVIRRLDIRECGTGIAFNYPEDSIDVRDCILAGNRVGLSMDGTDFGMVVNNQFLNNTKAGLQMQEHRNRTQVLHNTFVGNAFAGNADGKGGALYIGAFGIQRFTNNIVVGNNIGINCRNCDARFANNDVWGNVTNYAGDAEPGAGDISADPLFVNVGEADFHLRAASPCIDAGADVGVLTDSDGHERPFGAGPDIGTDEWIQALPGVVINEVMANPLNEGTGEFIELYNGGDSPLDLAGFLIDDGDSRDEIVGWQGGDTVLAAGGFAVVLDRDYAAEYEIPEAALWLTVGNATLGNGLSISDPVSLLLDDGLTVVSSYSRPFNPGNGVSAERIRLDAEDGGGAFVPSPCGATPGWVNCTVEPPAEPLIEAIAITEVMANPLSEATGEFVELLNTGDSPLDLAGWTLSDGDRTDVLIARQGGPTVLGAGDYAVILDPGYAGQYEIPAGTVLLTVGDAALGNGLATSDPITLRDGDGELRAAFSHPFNPGNGRSAELAILERGDVRGNWVPASCEEAPFASPGAANCSALDELPPAVAGLLINEVMANPLDEDTGEFIELINTTDAPIDAEGLIISDGDATDLLVAFAGGTTVVPPGGYAVILDPEYAGEYVIPADAVLLAPSNTTVGSGLAVNDPIELIGADAVSVLSAWTKPFNPGNGRSVERIDPGADDTPANWTASPCPSGSSPGRRNCAAGPGDDDPPPPDDLPDIVINEVMANPIVESTSEFVELINVGDSPADLAGFVIFDGDDADPLRGFQGGTTIVPAGGYALILDRDYQEGTYDIPEEAVLLTVSDGAIGSGLSINDPVWLLSAGDHLIDAFSHPFNPGNGWSIERVSPDAPDVPGSWVVAACDGGLKATPGFQNCAAGWEPPPPPDPADCDPVVAVGDLEESGEAFTLIWNQLWGQFGVGDMPMWELRAFSYSDCADAANVDHQVALVRGIADRLFRWDPRDAPHLLWWWDVVPDPGPGRFLRALDIAGAEFNERIGGLSPPPQGVPEGWDARVAAYDDTEAAIEARVAASGDELQSWHLDTAALECTEDIEVIVLPHQNTILVLWEGIRC